jgi:hypothetical protein
LIALVAAGNTTAVAVLLGGSEGGEVVQEEARRILRCQLFDKVQRKATEEVVEGELIRRTVTGDPWRRSGVCSVRQERGRDGGDQGGFT